MHNISPQNACGSLSLPEWLQTPIGQYTQKIVNQQVSQWVADIFGYYAVQLGGGEYQLLEHSRISNLLFADSDAVLTSQAMPSVDVVIDGHHLPFDSASLDLLIMPHTLEQSINPYALIREAERVLRPEGHLIIVGFNPRSLWGWWGKSPFTDAFLPQAQQYLPLSRLKDWLKVLSLDVYRGRFGGYVWPSFESHVLNRTMWLDKAGDRWWPSMAGFYMIDAVKHQESMAWVGKTWSKVPVSGRRVVASISSSCVEESVDEAR